jgi:biopolymer transport protein ExbD
MSAHGFGPLKRRTAMDMAGLHFGPNMTPMVDVVMVILVFFMVSAAFMGPEWLLGGLVPRPASTAQTGTTGQGPGPTPAPGADPLATSPVRFVIALRTAPDAGAAPLATGAGLTDQSIDAVMAELGRRIAGAADQVEVLIRAEPGVKWGPVVRVHELAQKLGVQRVGPETGPRAPTPATPTPTPASAPATNP